MKRNNTPQNAIVNTLGRQYGAERIILFGSHARGTARKGSDLDLVVIKKLELLF